MDVPEPLLGVSTLEGLGIRVDPTTGKAEYSRSYGLAVLYSGQICGARVRLSPFLNPQTYSSTTPQIPIL